VRRTILPGQPLILMRMGSSPAMTVGAGRANQPRVNLSGAWYKSQDPPDCATSARHRCSQGSDRCPRSSASGSACGPRPPLHPVAPVSVVADTCEGAVSGVKEPRGAVEPARSDPVKWCAVLRDGSQESSRRPSEARRSGGTLWPVREAIRREQSCATVRRECRWPARSRILAPWRIPGQFDPVPVPSRPAFRRCQRAAPERTDQRRGPANAD
jgi:hypothetical protein